MSVWDDSAASLSGEVYYRSKYLRSDTYNANIEANRIVVSEFGTMAYPDPCKNIFSKSLSILNLVLLSNVLYSQNKQRLLLTAVFRLGGKFPVMAFDHIRCTVFDH